MPWRRPIASLNYVLSSLVWRQDHNGFSHQDPGFIDHVVNKKADVIRVYLPPDANTLLSVGDHCLRSRHYVNVIVAGKQPAPNWLSMDQAILHCTRGIGIWDWASSDDGGEPDVVIASAGDVPTLEALAAVDLLRQHLPELKVRFVNVVDLMRLQPASEHPHGLSDAEFDSLFTTDRPVIFAYHGYPWLIHRLTYRRTNHAQPPRSRLQGGGHDHHAVRHGHAQRPRPVPPRHRRDRPRAGPRPARRPRPPADGRQADRGPRLHATRRRGRPGDRRLDVAAVGGDAPGAGRILVVNAGSSSLKLRVLDDRDAVVASADLPAPRGSTDAAAVADAIRGFGAVAAVGHRIVHGGTQFSHPVLIDAAVEARLRALTDLAPLHQPKSLAALDAVSAVLPDVPAVACFDTAFHATMPAAASTYALPPEWRKRWDLRRFGFHGLSHAYASRRVTELLGRPAEGLRLVTCHLGAGASLAAILDGRSVDTTMGFTPLEGLVMATRSGSVDPGLVLWLEEHAGTPPAELAATLEHRSGLLGLAGTADMRTIVDAAAAGGADARLALDVYIHRLRGRDRRDGRVAWAESTPWSSPAGSASTRRPSGRWPPNGSASSASSSTRRATSRGPTSARSVPPGRRSARSSSSPARISRSATRCGPSCRRLERPRGLGRPSRPAGSGG